MLMTFWTTNGNLKKEKIHGCVFSGFIESKILRNEGWLKTTAKYFMRFLGYLYNLYYFGKYMFPVGFFLKNKKIKKLGFIFILAN